MTLSPLRVAALLETAIDPYGAGEAAAMAAAAAFMERVLPEERSAHLEATRTFPEAELRAFATEGHLACLIPAAHGGAFHWPTALRLALRLAAHDLDTALCFGGTVLATTPLLVAATEAQARRPFEAIRRGDMAAFALSEWAHGSDLTANEATARAADDGFVLNGRKAPANNGSRGAFVVTLLRTSDDDGPFAHTLFLLERGLEGMAPHPQFPSIGYRNMDLSGVVLDGARIGADAVLGKVGEGFVNARRALEISRSGVAMLGSGVAVAAVARALTHAKERSLYGNPIGELGGVRVLVGGAIARALESIAVCRRAAWGVARAGRGARAWTSLAKLVAPRLAEDCVRDAGTVLGARSLMEDLPFARLRRAAPVLAIFDGSSQLQLDEVWRSVGAWADVHAIEPHALHDHLHTPVPFDAWADDDGTMARANPANELRALDGVLPGYGLEALGAAAAELGKLACDLRRAPQAIRFRVSDAAARLFGLACLAEAAARTKHPLLADALATRIADTAPILASALVEVADALAAPRPSVDLLGLAAGGSARAEACFAAM